MSIPSPDQPPPPDLGEHLATYQPERRTLLHVLGPSAVIQVAGLVLALVGLLVPNALLVSALGGFLVARSGVTLWRLSRNFGVQTELRSTGIVRHAGLQAILIPWSEIKSVNLSEGGSLRQRLDFIHIFTLDGDHLLYGGLRDFEFGRLLRLEHAAFMCPLVFRRLEQEEAVHFGAYALSPKGLQTPQFSVSWPRVQAAKLEKRFIMILIAERGWVRVAHLSAVPSARVFYDSLRHALHIFRPLDLANTEETPQDALS